MTDIFMVRGSHGELDVFASSGEVITYRSETDTCGGPCEGSYAEIARLDVDEWRAAYPGEDVTSGTHDILDFGYWSRDGVYEPPAYDWREDFAKERAAA